MPDPLTIDNLGPDASSRYAQDRKLYEESIFKEAKAVPIFPQAEIDVTQPFFASEYEQLFEMQKRNISWADFYPPPKFNEQKKRLFTHQILPFLGSEDKIEAQSARISATVRLPAPLAGEEGPRVSWQQERELHQQENEKKILISLMTSIHTLDKYLIDINSRRSQYQKG